ncbi:MAG: hypothetical protein ACJA07_001522 [Rhodococcus sp. (in: high G+C Gram-positive bacteria)]|jgi:hypothetical protein
MSLRSASGHIDVQPQPAPLRLKASGTRGAAMATARPICGAECHYGGLSSARKYASTELGWMWHCNRVVKAEGDRCWRHQPLRAGTIGTN